MRGVLIENVKGELIVRREVKFVYGFQAELDRLYGWGLQWGRGYKTEGLSCAGGRGVCGRLPARPQARRPDAGAQRPMNCGPCGGSRKFGSGAGRRRRAADSRTPGWCGGRLLGGCG